jgi:hypothetical protein
MTLAVTLPLSLLVIAACYFFLLEKARASAKRVAYTMHINERTEEAETLDFSVNLFEDETMGKWHEKIHRAFSIAEARRAENFQRMQQEYLLAKQKSEDAKKEQKIGLAK